jgi:protein-disulfide isomerase
VRFVYRDFPLDFHAGARPAAEAARCAAAMGRFWEYHDLLFVAQPEFSRDQLVGYAARLGLDRTAFASCLGRPAPRWTPIAGPGAACGTPTFFINGAGSSAPSPSALPRSDPATR